MIFSSMINLLFLAYVTCPFGDGATRSVKLLILCRCLADKAKLSYKDWIDVQKMWLSLYDLDTLLYSLVLYLIFLGHCWQNLINPNSVSCTDSMSFS